MLRYIKHKNTPGFALIEIVFMMAIIAIFAIGVVLLYNNMREKARDSQRMVDLTAIQSAMNQLYGEKSRYPGPNEVGAFLVENKFINIIPIDPYPYRDISKVSDFFPAAYADAPEQTCIEFDDMEFYNSFSIDSSGVYPSAGTSSDQVTVTSGNPVTAGTLEVEFAFTDIPDNFENITLSMDFIDLDLQGDYLSSGWKRLNLFETFKLYDAGDNLLDTLDDNDEEDDDFSYSISIADDLVSDNSLTLTGEIGATITLTRGSSLTVSNAEEGIENISLCGEIGEDGGGGEDLTEVCQVLDTFPWEENIFVDTDELGAHFAEGGYLGTCDGRSFTDEATEELCHITEEGEETIVVNESEVDTYLDQAGYFLGACEEGWEDEYDDEGGDGGGGGEEEFFDICHVGEDGEHALTVVLSAVQAHLAHGSYAGDCDGRTSGGDEFYEGSDWDFDCETQKCGVFHYVYGVADDPVSRSYGQYYEVSATFESNKNVQRLNEDDGNDADRLEIGHGVDLVNTHFLDPEGYPAGQNLFKGGIINAKVLSIE